MSSLCQHPTSGTHVCGALRCIRSVPASLASLPQRRGPIIGSRAPTTPRPRTSPQGPHLGGTIRRTSSCSSRHSLFPRLIISLMRPVLPRGEPRPSGNTKCAGCGGRFATRFEPRRRTTVPTSEGPRKVVFHVRCWMQPRVRLMKALVQSGGIPLYNLVVPLALRPTADGSAASFASHGSELRAASAASIAVAERLRSFRFAEQPTFESARAIIRGGVYMLDLLDLPDASPAAHTCRLQLIEDIQTLFRRALGRRVWYKSLASLKLLVAPPGEGAQEPHFDVRDRIAGQQTVSSLLYCTDTNSTAVTKYSRQVIRRYFPFDDEEPYTTGLELCSRSAVNFHSQPVTAGQFFSISGDCLHYGTRNEHPTEERHRIVRFVHFVHSARSPLRRFSAVLSERCTAHP